MWRNPLKKDCSLLRRAISIISGRSSIRSSGLSALRRFTMLSIIALVAFNDEPEEPDTLLPLLKAM